MTPHKATRFAWDREDEGWYPMGYVLGERSSAVVQEYEKRIRERLKDPESESIVLTEVTVYTGFDEQALGRMMAEAEEWGDYYDESPFLHEPDEREIREIVATSEKLAGEDPRFRSITAADVKALPLREQSKLYQWIEDGDFDIGGGGDFDIGGDDTIPEILHAPPGHVEPVPGQMEMPT
jgi:hypothetical protein